MAFEYRMTNNQNRADVILLSSKKVIILEFKGKDKIYKEDVAQAAGYGQSISHFHHETEKRRMEVETHMVYTHGDPKGNHDFKIDILHNSNFTYKIQNILKSEAPISHKECIDWISSSFFPTKNIADATRQLFKYGDLPNIKTIQEGDIKETLDAINAVISNSSIEKSIIFVSGVPGAGKTLVGLQTVYDHACDSDSETPIYLSGNGPLVNILQATLSTEEVDRAGESYIQELKPYREKYEYITPPQNIIVFDEAQRAWDTIDGEPGETEASILLQIGDRIAARYKKVTILCLVGDGQAIYLNEETGVPLWASALYHRNGWNVYAPDKYKNDFMGITHLHICPNLTLRTSIRNDFIDISPWVEAILNLDKEQAKKTYQELVSKGFKCVCFRNSQNLGAIANYIKKKYPKAHTGIVVSSFLSQKNEERVQMFGRNYKGSYVKAKEAYKWYMEESNNLIRGASQFLIQGIELDYPIVTFIGDYYIENKGGTGDPIWKVNPIAKAEAEEKARQKGKEYKNFEKVIQNVYRVLLTRSRKGMALYFPQDAKLDETYNWFKSMMLID